MPSRFYSRIKGSSSSDATRQGTKNSGVLAEVNDAQYEVSVRLHDDHGDSCISIWVRNRDTGRGHLVYSDKLARLFSDTQSGLHMDAFVKDYMRRELTGKSDVEA